VEPTTRVRREPDARARLLAAARTCLQEKGYAATTARDLVAASGTNLASIGYHFGGKEPLLVEALTECFDEWTAQVEDAVFGAEMTDPRATLERALVALIDGFAERRALLISCVEGYAPAVRSTVLRETLAAGFARAREQGADMIHRACAAMGTTPARPPEAFVSVLIAIVDGLTIQWLADPDATPDARQVLDVLGGMSLFAEPDPQAGSTAGPAATGAGAATPGAGPAGRKRA
jgi:AcrR family transcriptional regulator